MGGDLIKKLVIVLVPLITLISLGVFFTMTNRETIEISASPDEQKFTPEVLNAGNENQYVIDFVMNEEGKFEVDSTVHIKNTSADPWNEVVFYFIPNLFTKENSPNLRKPAVVEIETVKVNGADASFTLNEDTLAVQLEDKLLPDNETEISVQYSFTLPINGFRFTINSGNYYLAQWYPMVATYRNGRWNKEDYVYYAETYHTGFSDFTIHYEIPEGYTIVSTGDADQYPSTSSGSLSATNVKEFFMTILKDTTLTQGQFEDINVRLFDVGNYEKYTEDILQISLDAVQYFQQTFGKYPHKQLDIVLDEVSMEYPGIVTAGIIRNYLLRPEQINSTVVHEIAHQWFYGVISNDPFYDGWLDEGFATLTTGLFYAHLEGIEYDIKDNYYFQSYPLAVNLPVNTYETNEKSTYLYSKPAFKIWSIFKEQGGQKRLEDFLKNYYETYQFKELNTQEFVRFLSHYLDIEDDTHFEDWILLDK